MDEHGKKPTDALDKITGRIVINLYEDSFEVKTTETVDFFKVYAVAAEIMKYLEKVASESEEDLDKVDKIMLQ